MLHTRERMHELFARSEAGSTKGDADQVVEQVNRVERQAEVLLSALHSIYIALAAFAAATLVTLLGEGLVIFWGISWFRTMAEVGLGLFLVGVGALVFGSSNLLRATHFSLGSMRAEAAIIRKRQANFVSTIPRPDC